MPNAAFIRLKTRNMPRSQHQLQVMPLMNHRGVKPLQHLQKTIGNRSTGNIIHVKLKIVAPNDRYEREADATADRVMRMTGRQVVSGKREAVVGANIHSPGNGTGTKNLSPDDAVQPTTDNQQPIQGGGKRYQISDIKYQKAEVKAKNLWPDDAVQPTTDNRLPIQRKCAACEEGSEPCPNCAGETVQRMPEDSLEPGARSMEEQESGKREAVVGANIHSPGNGTGAKNLSPPNAEVRAKNFSPDDVVHRTTASGQQPAASGQLESRISQMRGGSPLPKSTRNFFEPRFGADFSKVRIHTGSQAAETAQAINAKAFTTGNNIVFNRGQYSPHSSSGRHLLAHELTHTIQQGSTKMPIQRSIQVLAHDTFSPNFPHLNRGQVVDGWLNQLCPDGNWRVGGGGMVNSPNRAGFCSRSLRRGVTNLRNTRHRTSCECLCDATAPGAPTIRVQAGVNTFFSGGQFISIPIGPGLNVGVNVGGTGQTMTGPTGTGEGLTHINPDGSFDTGATGRDPVIAPGAGDTAPHAGTGRGQTIRSPGWIVFGHELCGHVMNWQTEGRDFHAQTPEGDTTSVDIENRIRREHSTQANNLGIRMGNIRVRNAAGALQSVLGSIYQVSAGETLFGIARRLGIPWANRFSFLFRANGNRFTVADQNTIAAGERLLVRNIFYHEVIRRDTMSSIARTWAIPLQSLLRANPGISNPNLIKVGQRIVIPNS